MEYLAEFLATLIKAAESVDHSLHSGLDYLKDLHRRITEPKPDGVQGDRLETELRGLASQFDAGIGKASE